MDNGCDSCDEKDVTIGGVRSEVEERRGHKRAKTKVDRRKRASIKRLRIEAVVNDKREE